MINKTKCAHCENMIGVENGIFKMDINANYVCEECADKAVRMSVYRSGITNDYYGYFEMKLPDPLAKNTEEHTTCFYQVRGAAVARAIEMARKLYGENVVIIEK